MTILKSFQSTYGKISFVDRGQGLRNFLLVHNAGANHEMMGYTADYFSKEAKVISSDLLGHGSSDAPKVEYTPFLFAESLIQLCKAEKLGEIVVVGLNYGANIGLVMAQIAPELISQLVLIEPPIFMESWIVDVIENHIKDLGKTPSTHAEETVDSLFLKASSREKELALKAMKTTSSFVKASTYKHLLAWDKAHSFRCSLPTLLIQTSKPFCSEERFLPHFSHLHIGRVVDSGPWANLEVPAQVHAMIDRFLEVCQ